MFKKKKSTRQLVGNEPAPAKETPAPDKADASAQKPKRSPSKRSPMRSRTLLGWLSVMIALFIAFGATPLIRAVTSDTSAAVRIKSDLRKGERLTEDNLEVSTVHARDFDGVLLTDLQMAVGKYAAIDLQGGDILTERKIDSTFPSDDPYLVNLPDGKLAMSIAMAGSAESVSGKLRAGDVVRLYAYQNDSVDSGNYQAMSLPELQYLEVLAVTNDNMRDLSGQSQHPEEGSDKSEKIIATLTLAVSPHQAAALSGLNNSATLHAALVVRGDEAAKEEALTRQDAYFSTATHEQETADYAAPSASPSQDTPPQIENASPAVPEFSAAPPAGQVEPSANMGAAQ